MHHHLFGAVLTAMRQAKAAEQKAVTRAFSCRLPGQGGIFEPKVGIMSTIAAAEFARLRTRFPDWDIIRTRCGIFIARHRRTGEHITAPALADLENRLHEWDMRH